MTPTNGQDRAAVQEEAVSGREWSARRHNPSDIGANSGYPGAPGGGSGCQTNGVSN